MSRHRGFGHLDAAARKVMAAKGGKAATRRHRFTRAEAQAAGRLGGIRKSRNRHDRAYETAQAAAAAHLDALFAHEEWK